MQLIIDNHPFHYEMENLCRLFYPEETIRRLEKSASGVAGTDAAENVSDEVTVYTGLTEEADGVTIVVQVREAAAQSARQIRLPAAAGSGGRGDSPAAGWEREMAVLLYEALAEARGFRPKWGILTGVRPVKLMRRLIADEGETAAAAYFRERLLVSPEKTRLCEETAVAENAIVSLSGPDACSLYIAIPFCPSRCAYCSFVSHSITRAGRLVPEYVRLLCEEIKATGETVAALGLHALTVYIGGGTPTTLSAEDLRRVMGAVADSFDLSRLREYTVEAGRPDTITKEKLDAILASGGARISVNPQTMDDAVLEGIGRRHTAAQAETAFYLAREAGFHNINMDLIAGLPGDTPEGFSRSLNRILALAPESVTVHALSLKRSSALAASGAVMDGAAAARMLDTAEAELPLRDYRPYYLYRQSRQAGNLENISYARPGFEGLYNVFMMDETHTVFGCGASAVTRVRDPFGDKVERVFNFKYPYEYLRRFDEILRRGRGVRDMDILRPPDRRKG